MRNLKQILLKIIDYLCFLVALLILAIIIMAMYMTFEYLGRGYG